MDSHKILKECMLRITHSNVFQKSPSNIKLLSYLIEAATDETPPKEYTIAKELFNKEPEEINVRFYIYQLRKKLDEYYANEGKNDKYRITIDKGRYKIHIVSQEMVKSKQINYHLIYIPAITLLALFLLYSIFKSDTSKYSNSFIWNAYTNENQRVDIIMGDYYFFDESIGKDSVIKIRYTNVNSDEELIRFKALDPIKRKNFQKSEYNYISPVAGQISYYISKILPQNINGVDFKLTSNYKIENKNTIIVSSYSTLYNIKEIVSKLGVRIEYINNAKILIYSTNNKIDTFDVSKDVDYITLLKVKNKQDVNFTILLSIHAFGPDLFMERLTDVKYLSDLEGQLKAFKNKNFKALFKVYGIRTSKLQIDLISADELKSAKGFDLN